MDTEKEKINISTAESLELPDIEISKKYIKTKNNLKVTLKQKINFAVILASNSIALSSLTYPSGVANCGLILFLFLMLIALSINFLSGYLLVFCAEKKKAKSYTHLIRIMLGKYKIIVDLFYFIANLGIILSSILTFSDFMTGIFSQVNNEIISSKKSLFWIFIPNIFLIPILLRRNLEDMKYFSYIAVFAVILLAFYTFYLFCVRDPINWSEVVLFKPEGSFNVFNLLLFGYMNQQNLIDIFEELKKKNLKTFKHILKIQNSLLTLVYLSIAVFGYLRFYDHKDVKNKNIFAFDLEKTYTYVFVNFFVGLSVLLSMIVTFKPTKDLLISYFETNFEEDKKKINIFCTIFLQIILILTSSILELFEIGYIDIINFIAAVVMPFLCIYLPLFFYIKIMKKFKYFFILVPLFVINFYTLKGLLEEEKN